MAAQLPNEREGLRIPSELFDPLIPLKGRTHSLTCLFFLFVCITPGDYAAKGHDKSPRDSQEGVEAWRRGDVEVYRCAYHMGEASVGDFVAQHQVEASQALKRACREKKIHKSRNKLMGQWLQLPQGEKKETGR